MGRGGFKALAEVSSMDEEDFDLTPLLARRGGRAKAGKLFADIGEVIRDLNAAAAH